MRGGKSVKCYMTVIASDQWERGNLASSDARLLRHFTPCNDTLEA